MSSAVNGNRRPFHPFLAVAGNFDSVAVFRELHGCSNDGQIFLDCMDSLQHFLGGRFRIASGFVAGALRKDRAIYSSVGLGNDLCSDLIGIVAARQSDQWLFD